MQLYFDRLADDGIVGLHVSNKFFYLEPMFARLAAELKLEARVWSDNAERGKPGKNASTWIVLAKDKKSLGTLALPKDEQINVFRTGFVPLKSAFGVPVWTDSEADALIFAFHPSLQRCVRGWVSDTSPYYVDAVLRSFDPCPFRPASIA